MAQRAGSDHRVRSQVLHVSRVLGHHRHGVLFVGGQNGETAATGLPGKVYHRRPQRLDEPLKRRLPLRVALEVQGVAGPDDVASVEGRHSDAV